MGRHFAKKRFNPRHTPRGRRVTVKESTTLLPFLFQALAEQSKSSVKAMLAHGQISVNGRVTSQFDTPLTPNDIVGISYEKGKVPFNHPLLKIVWEDDFVIVVNKKEGLLSVGNAKERELTAYHLLSHYVKKTDVRNKILVLHRLDKDVSGLMIFARNRGVQDTFESKWNRMITEQTYIAVVEGVPEKDSGLLSSLAPDMQPSPVFIIAENGGEEAIARYKKKRNNEDYSLLELTLESRRNQIRAQLQELGHPVAGDKRYGAMTNPEERLMLHAQKLSFIHPDTGTEMCFDTQIPHTFTSLTK